MVFSERGSHPPSLKSHPRGSSGVGGGGTWLSAHNKLQNKRQMLTLLATKQNEGLQTIFRFSVNNRNFSPSCNLNEPVPRSHQQRPRRRFPFEPVTIDSLQAESHGVMATGGRTRPLSRIHKCSPLLARSGRPPSFPALSPGIKSLPSLTAFRSPGHADKNKHAEDHQKPPRSDPPTSRPPELEGSDPE